MNVIKIKKRAAKEADQIEELTEQLGSEKATVGLRLQSKMRRLLGALMKNELLTKQAAFTAMYYDQHIDDRPDISCVAVTLSNLRKSLAVHGISILTQHGDGWFLTNESKNRIQHLLDGMKDAAAPKRGHVGEIPKLKEFKIRDNVPIPDKYEAQRKYHFDRLGVGQSVEIVATRMNVQKAIQTFRKRFPDREFITRSIVGGIGVWRTK